MIPRTTSPAAIDPVMRSAEIINLDGLVYDPAEAMGIYIWPLAGTSTPVEGFPLEALISG
jgi:hypothetical protein